MRKRITAIMLAALMVLACIPAQTVFAAVSGSCGKNATWKFAGHTLLISGSGAMEDYESVWETPWVDYATQITRIVIDDGITRVGNYAFCGDTGSAQTFCNILNVSLGNTVKTIGAYAFSGTLMTSIEFPASLKKIGPHAFENTALRSVDCSNLDYIGEYAFSECNKFKGGIVTIGPKVTKYLDTAFFGTPIKGYDVSPANPAYSSLYGILYNKAMTVLLQFPEGKTATTYTVPSTVTTVAARALCNAVHVTTIVFPDSVRTIKDGALPSPSASIPYNKKVALKQVFFGKGLKNLAVNIFSPTSESDACYSAYFAGNMPAKTGDGKEFFNWYAPVGPGKVKVYKIKGNTTWETGNYDSTWLGKPALKSVTLSAAGTITVTYSKSVKASGYQIQYSTSSSFDTFKKVNVTDPAALTAAISKLKKGQTYYVRVRGFKKAGKAVFYSAWSSKSKIKITK